MPTVWHTAPPVLATYVHRIDPIVLSVGGIHVWWYGLGFALGFWQMHRYIQQHRVSLHLDARDGFALSLMVIAGVLAGGRAIEILFDEWPFYRDHASFIPRYWLGGMATHGLLIGAAVGCGLFCAIYQRSLLRVADALVIPGAFLMGVGRLGNFIDGQIVGGITDVAWGVKFPDAEGLSSSGGAVRRPQEPAARALPDARARHEPDARRHGRAIRVLVRVPAHLPRSVPRLPHAPPGARHRPDAEPGDGAVGGGAAAPIAMARTRPAAPQCGAAGSRTGHASRAHSGGSERCWRRC